MQRWERESVEKLAADMTQQMRESTGMLGEAANSSSVAEENASLEETHPPTNHSARDIPNHKSALATIRSMFSKPEARDSPSISNAGDPTTPTSITHATEASTPFPRRPLEFDLNPYGFDLVIDFHWSNDKKSSAYNARS